MNVFNGQDSALWNNIRKAFGGTEEALISNAKNANGNPSEIRAMYQKLRNNSLFSYEAIEKRFEEHQELWPKALWNQDAYRKYINPLVAYKTVPGLDNPTDYYLDMAQGDKASQRKWWLYHGFNYRDSKYLCGNAITSRIFMRLNNITIWTSEDEVLADLESGSQLHNEDYIYYYTDAARKNITAAQVNKTNKTITKIKTSLAEKYIGERQVIIAPYSDLWPSITINDATIQVGRVNRNEKKIFTISKDSTGGDAVTYINSANCISEIDGLASLFLRSFNGASATRLQTLKIGDEDIVNFQLTEEEFTLPESETLKSLNMRNCVKFKGSISVSKCHCLEDIDIRGTKIPSVNLPNGGKLKHIYFPDTIKSLRIRNQNFIEVFDIEGYSNIEQLFIEKSTNVPVEDIILNGPAKQRIGLYDITWVSTNSSRLKAVINKLIECTGYDESGKEVDNARAKGTIKCLDIITEDLQTLVTKNFPGLYLEGPKIINEDWDTLTPDEYALKSAKELNLGALGKTYAQIVAKDEVDGKTQLTWAIRNLIEENHIMNEALVSTGGTFMENDGKITFGSAPRDEDLSYYPWKSYNQTIASSVCSSPIAVKLKEGQLNPVNARLKIDYYLSAEASDRLFALGEGWEEIVNTSTDSNNARKGTYDFVNRKNNTNNYVSIGSNPLIYIIKYKKDSSINMLMDTVYFKPYLEYENVEDEDKVELIVNYNVVPQVAGQKIGSGSLGGWEHSDMRTYLNDEIYPKFPDELKAIIKPVEKQSSSYSIAESGTGLQNVQSITTDKLWLFSYREVFGSDDYEKEGPVYTDYFDSTFMRQKKTPSADTNSSWWLRTAKETEGGATSFLTVNNKGTQTFEDSNASGIGTLFGFCT